MSLADTGSEDIEAILPDSLISTKARDFFCRSVKGSNLVLVIDGEDPISYTIQDDIEKGSALVCPYGLFTAYN